MPWRKTLAVSMRANGSPLDVALRQAATIFAAWLVQHGYITDQYAPIVIGVCLGGFSLFHGVLTRSNLAAQLLEANRELSEKLEECRAVTERLKACQHELKQRVKGDAV